MRRMFQALRSLRNNVLAATGVALSLLSTGISIKVLGVSLKNDALFLTLGLVSAGNFLSVFIIEQFLYQYTELRSTSNERASLYYRELQFFLAVFEVTLLAVASVLFTPVSRLFFYAIDAERAALIKALALILLPHIGLFPFNQLNSQLLNCHGSFTFGYVLQVLNAATVCAGWIMMWVLKSTDIRLVAVSYSVAAAMVFCLQKIKIARMGIPDGIRLPTDRGTLRLILQSMKVRLGQNINNFLVQPIVTNYFSAMAPGQASIYSYANKIYGALQAVILGPLLTVFRVDFSRAWNNRDRGILRLSGKYLRNVLLLYLVAAGAVAAGFRGAFQLVFGRSVAAPDVESIFVTLCVLMCWGIIIIIESSLTQFIYVASKAVSIVICNTANIVTLVAVLFVLPIRSAYTVPLGLIGSQVVSTTLFGVFAWTIYKARFASTSTRQEDCQ